MKFVVLIILSIFSMSSFAADSPFFEDGLDTHIKFGGWSKHQDSKKYGSYDFNESHNGLGIQWWKGVKGTGWHIGAEYFQMKDSFGESAKMYSLASKYEFDFENEVLTSIDLLTGITLHDRSFVFHHYYRKDDAVVVTKRDIYRDTIVAPSLMVTFRFYDRFEIDITHIPEMSMNEYAVTFIRLGVKI